VFHQEDRQVSLHQAFLLEDQQVSLRQALHREDRQINRRRALRPVYRQDVLQDSRISRQQDLKTNRDQILAQLIEIHRNLLDIDHQLESLLETSLL
jgi:hypothetical protein